MSLKKPSLEIAANYAYTDKELESLSNVFEPVMEVEIKRVEEFQKEFLGPIIFFIFYGISTGFFETIGKNLWEVIKKKIASTVTKKRESGVSDLEFQAETEKGKIRFRLHSSDTKIIEKAIDQIPNVLKSAEETAHEIDYYEFDNDKKEWTH